MEGLIEIRYDEDNRIKEVKSYEKENCEKADFRITCFCNGCFHARRMRKRRRDAAEGGNGSEGGDNVLKVAAFEGGNGAEIWEKITAAFEEETGCKVELELSSELDQVLTKDIQNGDIPDIVYYNLGQESGFTETMLKEQR